LEHHEWKNGTHTHEPRRETSADKEREEQARVRVAESFERDQQDIRLGGTAPFHPVDWVLEIDGTPRAFIEYKRRFKPKSSLGEFWVDMYKLCSLEMLTRMSGLPWWMVVEFDDGTLVHCSERSRVYPTRYLRMEKLPMGAIGEDEFSELGSEEYYERVRRSLCTSK